MTEKAKLIALHKHWGIADSIAVRLTLTPPRGKTTNDIPSEVLEFAEHWSSALAMHVFYGLVYVVAEGFVDLGLSDEEAGRFLADTEKYQALRRFRNAVFHYQEDFESEKLVTFLQTDYTGEWVRGLHRALGRYFEKTLDIRALMQGFQ